MHKRFLKQTLLQRAKALLDERIVNTNRDTRGVIFGMHKRFLKQTSVQRAKALLDERIFNTNRDTRGVIFVMHKRFLKQKLVQRAKALLDERIVNTNWEILQQYVSYPAMSDMVCETITIPLQNAVQIFIIFESQMKADLTIVLFFVLILYKFTEYGL